MTDKRLAWEGGKCRVPMWSMGCPDGFCDQQSFGEQLPVEILYHERFYAPHTAPYGNKVPYCGVGPCCPAHGGPKEDEPRFFHDGYTNEGRVMWCCVGPDFENLQESPAGFDGNPFVARSNYLAALAAATGTAKTAQRVECEASQSGPKGNAQPTPTSPTLSLKGGE